MSKRIPFNPLGSEPTKYGQLVIGQDGTMLYTSHNVQTGELTTVPLFDDTKSLVDLLKEIDQLTQKYREYAKRMAAGEPDHTPATESFHDLLASFKPTGKPN